MALTSSATRHGLPAQLLIEEVLRRQERQTPRTALARAIGRSPISAKDRPWYLGAKGELAVGALLERLPRSWRVLHSMPIGHAADIDHIVIGPPGVFVLNTKHHRGRRVWAAGTALFVEGRRHRYIEKAEREGARVVDALACAGVFGTEVTPMIVLVGVASLTIRDKPTVPVLRAERLVSCLTAQPARMDDEVVEELARRLDIGGLWADVPAPMPDSRARFAALDSEVARARTIRQVWALGAAALAAGAMLAVVQSALAVLALVLTH